MGILAKMSNEKRAPGCLGFLGDEILPSDIGIMINHYKDLDETTRIQRKVRDPGIFFSWLKWLVNSTKNGFFHWDLVIMTCMT